MSYKSKLFDIGEFHTGIDMKNVPARLALFNRLNKLAMVATLVRALFVSFFGATRFEPGNLAFNLAPAILFALIILLNKKGYYKVAMFCSFYIIPVVLTSVGLLLKDYSISVFILILFVVSFFLLERKIHILSSFVLLATCFIAIRWREMYAAEQFTGTYSQLVAIADLVLLTLLGFFVLSFIRNEIDKYQQKLEVKNQRLRNMNTEMVAQKNKISRQAARMEQQQEILVASDKLKTQLLSVISHDLRLPLVSVKNMFDVYEKKLMSPDELIEYVPQLNHEVNRALELLENMLQWSRQQMGEAETSPETFTLAPLAENVISFYNLSSLNKKITIHNCIRQEYELQADRQLVKMVLRNLLSNAIKFTPDSGEVHITAEHGNGRTHIHVTDNGVGMTPEQVQRVLGRHEHTTAGTRHESGSGLGLKLCQEFIERNGGGLHIKSKPGHGSTVSFTLPDTMPEREKQQPPSTAVQYESAPVIYMDPDRKPADYHAQSQLGAPTSAVFSPYKNLGQ
jgi:two-component system, sensor histidine kinase and response regulator